MEFQYIEFDGKIKSFVIRVNPYSVDSKPNSHFVEEQELSGIELPFYKLIVKN